MRKTKQVLTTLLMIGLVCSYSIGLSASGGQSYVTYSMSAYESVEGPCATNMNIGKVANYSLTLHSISYVGVPANTFLYGKSLDMKLYDTSIRASRSFMSLGTRTGSYTAGDINTNFAVYNNSGTGVTACLSWNVHH